MLEVKSKILIILLLIVGVLLPFQEKNSAELYISIASIGVLITGILLIRKTLIKKGSDSEV